MTDTINEARALLAKATPGPWLSSWKHDDIGDVRDHQPGWEANQVLIASGSGRVVYTSYYDGVRLSCSEPDADLIAAAPRLLAALVADLDRTRAELAHERADGERRAELYRADRDYHLGRAKKAEAELAAALAAMPLRAIETCAYLARKSGELGSSAAYLEVHDWLDAYHAAPSTKPAVDWPARALAAEAELVKAREAMPTAGESEDLLWALTYLRANVPASTGIMREADAVARRLTAYHTAHPAASPAAEMAAASGSAPDLPEPCAVCSEALCECGRWPCAVCDGSGGAGIPHDSRVPYPRDCHGCCPECNGTGRAGGGGHE